MTSSPLGAASDIDGVLDRMADLEKSLPAADGVATFNRMYYAVTCHVDTAVDQASFRAGDFIARLDVRFANHFFAACDADRAGQEIPMAWRPLFRNRARPRTHPVQFAMAGMNAHISHDLAFAVVETCKEIAAVPDSDTDQHADYTHVNDVLEVAAEDMKQWFSTGVVAHLDALGGRVDDAFAMFGIHLARAGAWELAETLWALDDNPRLLRMLTAGLRRAVQLSSEGILL